MNASVEHAVNRFFEAYPLTHFRKGEVIARPHTSLPGVLRLEKGQIAQYDISGDGRQVIVNIFKPPAFFPMAWAINREENIYFFEAKTAVVARCAPPEAVVDFIKREPEVLFNLLSRVYRGTEGVLRRMAHALGGNAASLILFEIIVSCRRFAELNKDNQLVLALTDQELADHTGLSRETVNRELQQLKHEGLISLGYGKITIPHLEKLEEFLGSCL